MKIIDATGGVVGRMASSIAKQVLNGNEVVVLNIEKSVFSGEAKMITAKYYRRRQMQQKSNPAHTAKWPRRPDMLFKTIVERMLPKRTSRSKDALAKLRVYIGTPEEFVGKETEKMEKKLACRTVSLEEVCSSLGWKCDVNG